MKISLSSASRVMSDRKPSPLNSRKLPASVMRPSTRQRWPEIIVISPVKCPGPCFAIGRSRLTSGWTISMAPERSTKNGTAVSPGAKTISPGVTCRTFATARTRPICDSVKTGKACVYISRTLGTGADAICSSFTGARLNHARSLAQVWFVFRLTRLVCDLLKAPRPYFAGLDFVHIAPDPRFSRFDRTNERVFGVAKMLCRVLVLGRIAAAHVAAFEAQPQMHPCVMHLHALFANVLVGTREFDLIEMFARSHVNS